MAAAGTSNLLPTERASMSTCAYARMCVGVRMPVGPHGIVVRAVLWPSRDRCIDPSFDKQRKRGLGSCNRAAATYAHTVQQYQRLAHSMEGDSILCLQRCS